MTSELISLDHGSGGKIAHRLTAELLLPLFDNPILSDLHDGAVLKLNDSTRIAFSTDTFTVTPLFFPGGDIGELAVNGTINDVAMCGATPLFISLALIIEEGFPMADLTRILHSIQHPRTHNSPNTSLNYVSIEHQSTSMKLLRPLQLCSI